MRETNLCSRYRYRGKGSPGCRLDRQRPRQWRTATLVDMASQEHICEDHPLDFMERNQMGSDKVISLGSSIRVRGGMVGVKLFS